MQLGQVVTRDVCADRYLTKQRRRARQAISKLSLPSNDPPMKVYECGATLKRIVREVCLDREARNLKRPANSRVLTKAAELLVDILHDVCKHNENINENPSDPLASDVDANIYTYLISDPPPSEEGDFVIDQLRNFPQSEWKHLLEYLTTIADDIRQNASSQGQLGSIRYASKIEAMVNDYTSTAFEPSSSSHQRPASSRDRESQRRQYY